jgi:hypothetical protein
MSTRKNDDKTTMKQQQNDDKKERKDYNKNKCCFPGTKKLKIMLLSRHYEIKRKNVAISAFYGL